MGIELEQKYILTGGDPRAVEEQLLALLAEKGHGVEFLGEKRQRDLYYDTLEDFFLLGGGSLRVRQKGETRVLTVKTPLEGEESAGTFRRREDELTLDAGAEPADFLRGLLPGVDLESLRPVAEVENLRRTWMVTGPAGARVELALDDVTYRNPRTGRQAGERQVELERLSGTEEDLRRLIRDGPGRLSALQAVTGSKYQRARAQTA